MSIKVKHNGTEIPDNGRHIMITYKKEMRSGMYGERKTIETITKRGFYTKLLRYYNVPSSWDNVNGVMLPCGWNGDKLQSYNVLYWEEID